MWRGVLALVHGFHAGRTADDGGHDENVGRTTQAADDVVEGASQAFRRGVDERYPVDRAIEGREVWHPARPDRGGRRGNAGGARLTCIRREVTEGSPTSL